MSLFVTNIVMAQLNIKFSDLLISTPFINLPSRELKDYYRLIKRPVCLKSVQKAVKGIKGRDKPTGQTLLKSWQSFEEESSYIWNNAREYNEDESEISELAGILEVCPSCKSFKDINLMFHKVVLHSPRSRSKACRSRASTTEGEIKDACENSRAT